MKTMKAMVANGYGSPEVYELQTVTKPTPKSNEILVKVAAASATTADTMMRTGKPYFGRLFTGLTKPKNPIPGTGFAGTIEEMGTEVQNFQIGDRVFGETVFAFSACADYIVIPADGVVLPMLDNMKFEEAANFCDGHLTSFNFLTELYQVEPDQRVLINGAAGSLGTSAVQIAKYFGAHVTAVCGSRNFGLIKSLGADEIIDYKVKDFTTMDHAFDLIYDTVGTSSFGKCKNVLNENGVYLSPVLKMPMLFDMFRTCIVGSKKAKFEATGMNSIEKLKTMTAGALELYKAGKLKTVIDRQFPMEKLVEAHRYLDSGYKKANVVLINS